MKKFYEVNGVSYVAQSKQELKKILSIKNKDIITLEDKPVSFVDLNLLIKKKREIKYAIENYKHVNKPTRSFEIGEEVLIGNLNDFYVKDIFNEGKIILIENNDSEYRICLWHEIVSKNKKLLNKSVFEEEKLNFNFYQTELSDLLSKYYYFGIDMNPSYQRGFVWNQEQKELLIESIFQNIDIGRFVFVDLPYEENADYSLEILDGKQRLSTIIDFIEDKIQFKGHYYFSDLSFSDQRKFKRIKVNISNVDKKDLSDKEIIKYFVKFNSTGTPIDQNFLKELKDSLK